MYGLVAETLLVWALHGQAIRLGTDDWDFYKSPRLRSNLFHPPQFLSPLGRAKYYLLLSTQPLKPLCKVFFAR